MRRLGALAAACAVVVSIGGASAERFAAPGGDVVVQPMVHAGVRVDYGGKVVYVDPWSRSDLAAAPPADLILITDADAGGHHLDTAAIQKLRKNGTTVVTPASGRAKVPDGVVMANGEQRTFGDIAVEAVGSYDLIPGEPFHAKGVANGYLVTIGGMRILFAGVTECVPEIRALRSIDVMFVPMNLPNRRMTPPDAAACVGALKPKVAYPYHYDQDYTARLAGRGSQAAADAAAQSVRVLADALKGQVDVRGADWYPAR